MKIYEKPMANIEELEVIDVITSSDPITLSTEDATAVAEAGVTGNTLVFEW